MALDFAVLGQSGAPERTVSLGVDLHHDLVINARAHGLARFQIFANYYEDAEVVVDDLPGLVEQIAILRVQTRSDELRRFLDALLDLIDYAVVKGQALHAIAD